MKKEYIDFYLAVTDIKKLRPGIWYNYPVSSIKAEFIEWYYKSTMAIDFSQGKTHFMVNFYPTEAEKNKILSSVGYNPSLRKKKVIEKSTPDPRSLKGSGKIIPGTDRPISDIAKRILEKEEKARYEKNKEHLKRLEHRRRLDKFLKQEDDLDGL